jgi:hypothetical protein
MLTSRKKTADITAIHFYMTERPTKIYTGILWEQTKIGPTPESHFFVSRPRLRQEIIATMPPKQADNESMPLEPVEFDDDTKTVDFLTHDDDYETSMLCNCGRGIIQDFKRTTGTWWYKEMTNFNQKTIAVSVFIFFAAVAPAITFGAVYSKVSASRVSRREW